MTKRGLTRFLSPELWPRLQTLAKGKGRRAVAVPFVGKGSVKRLPLQSGDLLVCRLDEATVRAGLTDPKEILGYLQRGVEVHAVNNLHAKVFVFGRSAIIGSSNLSGYSEHSLLEAAIETSSADIVRSSRDFIESLRGNEVGPEYARRLVRIYRPPKLSGALTPRIRKQRIHHDDIVALLLELSDFDEIDCVAEQSARRLGRTRLADPERSTVDTFRWEGKLPKAMKRGVRVLQLIASGTRRRVYPPARVLEVKRYTSRRGGSRAIVCVEM
jgi:hypothetical protein